MVEALKKYLPFDPKCGIDRKLSQYFSGLAGL